VGAQAFVLEVHSGQDGHKDAALSVPELAKLVARLTQA
jgi:hypothetical protein